MGFQKTTEPTTRETPSKISREHSVTLYEGDLQDFIETLKFFGYDWTKRGDRKAWVRCLNSLRSLAGDLEPYYDITLQAVGSEYQLKAIKTKALKDLEKKAKTSQAETSQAQ